MKQVLKDSKGGQFSFGNGSIVLHKTEFQVVVAKGNSDKTVLMSSNAILIENIITEGTDELGGFEESTLTYHWSSHELEVVYHIKSYKAKTYSIVWADIKNLETQSVKVESITLLAAKDDKVVLGNGIKDWVIFKNTIDKSGLITTHHFGNPQFDIRDTTGSGLEDGAFTIADAGDNTVITSNYLTVLRSISTGQSVLMGFLTVKSQFSFVRFSCSNDESTFVTMEALCSLDNIPLLKGQSICSERLLIDFDDAFKAIDRYSNLSGKMNKPEGFKDQFPPTGWCSWYFFYESVTEQNILDNLEFIKNNKLPIEYIQIDMGWEERLGEFYPNHKFPRGMKWLAIKIHSYGLKAGIWISPFWVEPRSEVHRDHPEWLLRDKDGKLIIFNCHIDGYVIDTTIAEARQWITDNFRKIKEDWGYDYVKVDFLRSVAVNKNAVYANPVTRAEALRLGMEAIRLGVGEDTFILACGGQYGPTLGIANGNRTSNDIGADWNTLKITFKKNILRYWMNQNWWVNDPDCLLIRGTEEGTAGNQCFEAIRKHGCGTFNDVEVRTILTLFRATGGLMFAGDDLTQLRDDKLQLMKPFLKPTGRAAIPRDMFSSRFPGILHTQLENGTHEVAIVNWSDFKKTLSFTLDELIGSENANTLYDIHEYWSDNKLDLVGIDHRLYLENVEPHGCRYLILNNI